MDSHKKGEKGNKLENKFQILGLAQGFFTLNVYSEAALEFWFCDL